MPSTRQLRLGEWGISEYEYKELSYFALQYESKKQEAAALLTIKLSTPAPVTYHRGGQEFGTFLPRGRRVSDPVAETAARRDRLLREVRMIEQAAKAAAVLKDGHSIYAALLRAVTTRSGVQAVMTDPDARPPCGKNEFYEARRKFFWILREMRNVDLESLP